MTLDDLIRSINPETYANLRHAVALGKWPDGREIAKEQKALCLEAMMLYENNINMPEQERVGYVEPKQKKPEVEEQPINFKNNT